MPLPSVASAARLRLTYSGVDGTSDAATLELGDRASFAGLRLYRSLPMYT
jgi:hypothetical protein